MRSKDRQRRTLRDVILNVGAPIKLEDAVNKHYVNDKCLHCVKSKSDEAVVIIISLGEPDR